MYVLGSLRKKLNRGERRGGRIRGRGRGREREQMRRGDRRKRDDRINFLDKEKCNLV